MSKQPQSQWKRIVTLAVGLALLIAAGTLLAEELRPTSASSTGPEMRLTITDPPNACIDGACQLPLGEMFTLAVEIVAAPSDGYVGAQSFLQFGTALQTDLTYTPAADTPDEIVWPDCEGATALRERFDGLTGNLNTDYTVSHGCLTGLFDLQPSNYTGNFLEVQFACSPEDSQTEVLQLPYNSDVPGVSHPGVPHNHTIPGTSGSAFGVRQGDFIVLTPPKLTNLTIRCGEPPTPTPTITPTPPPTNTPGGPTPTITPSPTPAVTDTPTPTVTPSPTVTPTPTPVPRPCGDVNGDGAVNSQDALWLLWLTSGVIEFVPFSDDLNGDGVVGPVDALLILQIEANLFICR